MPFFKYQLKDKVRFGELEGVVTFVDNHQKYGVEAEFIDDKGKKVCSYFDNTGKFKGQDTHDVLIILKDR